MFASLGGSDDKRADSAHEEVRAEPAPKQEAGIGGSITSLWDSVKSGLSFGGKSETAVAATGEIATSVDRKQAQALINAYRAQNGLGPVQLSPLLESAALAHSRDLAQSDRISHYGSDGSDSWDRVRRVGYEARVTAENVGTGQRSLSEVFRGWQNSPDHNANLLLPDAEEMGIAMVNEPNTQFKTFWTLVLGAPAASPVKVSQQHSNR
jgi:uncharacterized protein YkwD